MIFVVFAKVEGPSEPVWKSTSVSGAPDNSPLSHFSAMTLPCWLRRAVRNRHRHAIEQASRRWRGGRHERAVNLISTQVATLLEVARAPHLTSNGMPANCTAPSDPWSFMARAISSHLEAS